MRSRYVSCGSLPFVNRSHRFLAQSYQYTTSSKDPRITIQLDASLEQPSWGADDLSCPTLPEVVSDVDRKVYLIMSVTDTGAGMKKTELSRLFQRFSQVEPVFSIKAGGSGLVSLPSRASLSSDPDETNLADRHRACSSVNV
jgi:hypothetical protein